MRKTFLAIIGASLRNGLDPVNSIMEYLEEKDSRITRREAESIVARYRVSLLDCGCPSGAEHLPECNAEHES